ncbi:MAG: preprotein translocase subunit SecE [Chloroflexia bacterium]
MAKQSRLAKVGRWFRDAIAELRRVVWPTPQETRNLTLVVIGLSVALGLLMGFFDWLFSVLYQLIVSLGH